MSKSCVSNSNSIDNFINRIVLPLCLGPPTFVLHAFKCLCSNSVGAFHHSVHSSSSIRGHGLFNRRRRRSDYRISHSFILSENTIFLRFWNKPQLHWLGWRWLWSGAPIYDQVAFIVDLSMKQHLTQLAGITIHRRRRNQLSQVITIPSTALNSTRRQIDNGMIRRHQRQCQRKTIIALMGQSSTFTYNGIDKS